MKNQLLNICILCLVFSCNTVKEKTISDPKKTEDQLIVDDSTVYSVVNYLFTNKSSNPFLIYKKVEASAEIPLFIFTNDSSEIEKVAGIFNAKDLEYMQTQKLQYSNFQLDQTKIKNRIIITTDSVEQQKNIPYCFISFPVFNAIKDKFIIQTGYKCGSFLCAEGATFIYQRKGYDWIIIKVIDQWIS